MMPDKSVLQRETCSAEFFQWWPFSSTVAAHTELSGCFLILSISEADEEGREGMCRRSHGCALVEFKSMKQECLGCSLTNMLPIPYLITEGGLVYV